MKFKDFLLSIFVLIIAVCSILAICKHCNKNEPTIKTSESNNIFLEVTEVKEVEEDGVKYLDRVITPFLANTEELPTHGFKFNAKWTEETDKVLKDYFEIGNSNGFSATLRVKQPFEEEILLEIVSNPEEYYGAFIITYEGVPTAIKGLPSEVTMKAGSPQEFDLSCFNSFNPNASEEYNDFSVDVKYYGSIKVKDSIFLTVDNPLWEKYGNGEIEGSEKTYSDIFNILDKFDYLVTAKIEGNVLILDQVYSLSRYCLSPLIYMESEHEFGECIVFEKFQECISTPYAEVTITEKTSGYAQKVKVYMDVDMIK